MLSHIKSYALLPLLFSLSEQLPGKLSLLLEYALAEKSQAREVLIGLVGREVCHDVLLWTSLILFEYPYFLLYGRVLCDSV